MSIERIVSLREAGTFTPVTGVGFSPAVAEQAQRNANYLFDRFRSALQRKHWERPAAEVHEPNYHPVPLDEFLAEVGRQQRDDQQFLYDLQRVDVENYFSRN